MELPQLIFCQSKYQLLMQTAAAGGAGNSSNALLDQRDLDRSVI